LPAAQTYHNSPEGRKVPENSLSRAKGGRGSKT